MSRVGHLMKFHFSLYTSRLLTFVTQVEFGQVVSFVRILVNWAVCSLLVRAQIHGLVLHLLNDKTQKNNYTSQYASEKGTNRYWPGPKLFGVMVKCLNMRKNWKQAFQTCSSKLPKHINKAPNQLSVFMLKPRYICPTTPKTVCFSAPRTKWSHFCAAVMLASQEVEHMWIMTGEKKESSTTMNSVTTAGQLSVDAET